MRALIAALSLAGLVLTLGPSLLVFGGGLDWKTHTQLMFAGMLIWFAFAPLWMKRKPR